MTLLSILAALGFAAAIRLNLHLYVRKQDAGRRAWPYALLALAAIGVAGFTFDLAGLWWLIGFLVGPTILFLLAAAAVSLRLCWWGLTRQVGKLETAAELVVGLKVAAEMSSEDDAAAATLATTRRHPPARTEPQFVQQEPRPWPATRATGTRLARPAGDGRQRRDRRRGHVDHLRAVRARNEEA